MKQHWHQICVKKEKMYSDPNVGCGLENSRMDWGDKEGNVVDHIRNNGLISVLAKKTQNKLGVQGEQNLKHDAQVCDLYTCTDSGVIQR